MVRGIQYLMDLDVSRYLGLQCLKAFFYGVDDVDGVGAGLLLDDHDHPWHSVAPSPLGRFLVSVCYFRQITQTDKRIAFAGDHSVSNLSGISVSPRYPDL